MELIDRPDRKNLENLDAYDLVVLDLILPGCPGETILKQIKQSRKEFPVLVLTAKQSIFSKKKCFNLGADDYLTKPFDLLELELRIEALLRRYVRAGLIKLGEVIINCQNRLILKDGQEIKLTNRAWSLLDFLLKNRNSLVTKSEIIKNVWKDTVVTEDSVRTYIKELRKVLPKNSIVTYKGKGYRLVE